MFSLRGLFGNRTWIHALNKHPCIRGQLKADFLSFYSDLISYVEVKVAVNGESERSCGEGGGRYTDRSAPCLDCHRLNNRLFPYDMKYLGVFCSSLMKVCTAALNHCCLSLFPPERKAPVMSKLNIYCLLKIIKLSAGRLRQWKRSMEMNQFRK